MGKSNHFLKTTNKKPEQYAYVLEGDNVYEKSQM